MTFPTNEPVYFRRAVGFTLKVDITRLSRVRVIMPPHGKGERSLELERTTLRRWMAMNEFRVWPAEREMLETLEAQDLVYWSRERGGRATTGAPLVPGHDGPIALRDGIGVTIALKDDEEIKSFPFMARRGALDEKTLHGVRLSSAERGVEAYAIDVYAGLDVRCILPLLNGRHTRRDIVRELGEGAGMLVDLDWRELPPACRTSFNAATQRLSLFSAPRHSSPVRT